MKGVKIVHVITGLGTGGAETMLVKLLGNMDRDRFDPVVVSLMEGGAFRDVIAGMGIPVYEMGMKRGVPGPMALVRLARLGRRLQPDLIQGWMYHGNLAAHAMRKFCGAREMWNVRHSIHDLGHEIPMTRTLIRLGARLSGRPERIIFNSRVSLDQHVGLGFRRENCEVVPNGFDLDRFRPDHSARSAIRGELGLAENALLVGMVGRLHPHKGQAAFLEAAAAVHRTCPEAAFVMAGRDVTPSGLDLGGHPAADRLHALGERQDVPRLMAALDVLCVSSVTEAFPNVLGEAMACGVPCVTTDVGDAASIVGEIGKVVPPGDPAALAASILDLLGMEEGARQELGARGRERVSAEYSLAAVVGRYETLYDSFGPV